jgi:hypothetical protein
MKRYNIYQILVEEKINDTLGSFNNERVIDSHTLIFLKQCDTEELAEHWLHGNREKYVRYIVIPEYYYTDWD